MMRYFLLIACVFYLTACVTDSFASGWTPYQHRGLASWYGGHFHHKRTSSGMRYNMYALTAAHRTLPLLSYVRVTNLNNRRSIIVQINDRGPFHSSRMIDLSYAAARALGILRTGVAPVEIQRVNGNPPPKTHSRH